MKYEFLSLYADSYIKTVLFPLSVFIICIYILVCIEEQLRFFHQHPDISVVWCKRLMCTVTMVSDLVNDLIPARVLVISAHICTQNRLDITYHFVVSIIFNLRLDIVNFGPKLKSNCADRGTLTSVAL